jgi:hypothetical protein
MLELRDPQLRLVLLNHLAVRLTEAGLSDLTEAGLDGSLLDQLRRLRALDLSRLAAMRSLSIGVSLDGKALEASLRTVALVSETKDMETYFIRHGASTGLMNRLFKLRVKLTLRRRRDMGVKSRCGRLLMPDQRTQDRIFRVWHDLIDPTLRARYFQLHQAFPHLSIAVLETVIRQYEAQS